jgi:endonuclease III
MGFPWRLAMKAIPWGTLLANVPTIMKSADELLNETRARQAQAQAAGSREDHLHVLARHVAALQTRDRETAELLKQLTGQVSALTTATEVLEARARWLLIATIVSALLAIAALAVAIAT